MAADWLFWAIAAAAAALCLGAVLAPLLRGAARGERRASHDMQVHRDQLREIDTDLARGVLSEAEAAATRIEVSRRLLAAAEAEAAEKASTTAPADPPPRRTPIPRRPGPRRPRPLRSPRRPRPPRPAFGGPPGPRNR